MTESAEGSCFYYQVTKECNMYRASMLDIDDFGSLQRRMDKEGKDVCPLFGRAIVVRSSEQFPEQDIQEYVYEERERLLPGLYDLCSACLAPTLISGSNYASSLVVTKVNRYVFELAPELGAIREDLE